MLGSSSVLFEAEDSVMLRQLELLENDGPVDGEDTELDTAESIARELSGLVSQAVKGGSAQVGMVRPSAELRRQGDGCVVATVRAGRIHEARLTGSETTFLEASRSIYVPRFTRLSRSSGKDQRLFLKQGSILYYTTQPRTNAVKFVSRTPLVLMSHRCSP